jgi:hypothetical protein
VKVRELLSARRPALVDQWVEQTLATYPAATARLMAAEVDPFRNPAGHALRENLAVLFDAAILSDDWDAAKRALGEIVRLRAVQDFSADQAVGFIAMLKPIVEQAFRPVIDIDARIDQLTKLALGMHEECRGRIEEIRANELRRRTWNLTRARA